MNKVKLKALRETWGDARVTVYESEDGVFYVEYAMMNNNDQLVGCFPQIVRRSKEPIMRDDYVALIDKKTPLLHKNVEIDFNNRPRIASDWIQLHAIDTIRERTERSTEDLRGYIPQE